MMRVRFLGGPLHGQAKLIDRDYYQVAVDETPMSWTELLRGRPVESKVRVVTYREIGRVGIRGRAEFSVFAPDDTPSEMARLMVQSQIDAMKAES